MKWIAISIFALFSCVAFAAQIDGTWRGEMKSGGKKAAGKAVPVTLNLKAEGNQLTGTVSMAAGKKGRSRPVQIQEGRIDGDSFSFTTVQKGKKGEKRQSWRGSVSGDEIHGTTGRGKRGSPFTARRG